MYFIENNARNSTVRHRPVNLRCEGRSRTTLLTCTVVEETFNNCSTSAAEPTPTPPSTPQDCQMCVMSNNAVAPEVRTSQNHHKKIKRKCNCCVSVPDSPDDPHSPSEPRCLMSLCRHKAKSISAIEGRPHRTHGHWSSAKLRVLFRVIGKNMLSYKEFL